MNSIRFCAFALVTFIVASADPGKADETCDPMDQLQCACSEASSKSINLTVSACFIGDLNTPTTTLVDNLFAQAFSALNWPVAIDQDGKAIAGVPNFAGPKCDQDDVTLCGDYATVWETWTSTNQMFRQGPPPAWDSFDQQLPAACNELDVQSEIAVQIDKHSPWAEIPTASPPRLLDEYTNLDPEKAQAMLVEMGMPEDLAKTVVRKQGNDLYNFVGARACDFL